MKSHIPFPRKRADDDTRAEDEFWRKYSVLFAFGLLLLLAVASIFLYKDYARPLGDDDPFLAARQPSLDVQVTLVSSQRGRTLASEAGDAEAVSLGSDRGDPPKPTPNCAEVPRRFAERLSAPSAPMPAFRRRGA